MSSDPAIVEALGSTDLFGSLDRRALKRVAGATKTVHHKAGKTLARQGEGGHYSRPRLARDMTYLQYLAYAPLQTSDFFR